MSRRLMLRKASGGGGRLYIFQNGEYGTWLNGAEFQLGGYTEGQASATTISISGGTLNLTVGARSNRTCHRCIGIALPRGIGSYKKAGISMDRSVSDRDPSHAFGVSESFVTATTKDAAFGVYQEVSEVGGWNGSVALHFEREFEIENPSVCNYAYVWLGKYTAQVTLSISEIWIEV